MTPKIIENSRRGLLALWQFVRWRQWRFEYFRAPRPGRCHCCNRWTLLRTNETPAYSAYDGAFLCTPCAEKNDEETRIAWSEYYAGCL